jgi:hypothetical protein
MKYKVCNLQGFEGLYHIYEDGSIYSVRKQRLLKQYLNRRDIKAYSYYYVCLTGHNGQQLRIAAHTVITHHFYGPKPSPHHEVNHKDLDKLNNHYTNLEWITHAENIIHARNKKPWKSGHKTGEKMSESTKRKMSEIKMKKTLLFNDSEEFVFKSIEHAANYLQVSRRTVERHKNSYTTVKGFKIRV